MWHPKVLSVVTCNETTLLIEFDNRVKKLYDITPLLSRPMFYPLQNPAIFKSVKVEAGGYAVSWNSDIDISEHELWSNGKDLIDATFEHLPEPPTD